MYFKGKRVNFLNNVSMLCIIIFIKEMSIQKSNEFSTIKPLVNEQPRD